MTTYLSKHPPDLQLAHLALMCMSAAQLHMKPLPATLFTAMDMVTQGMTELTSVSHPNYLSDTLMLITSKKETNLWIS